jgi:hypothetical protein
MRTQTHDKYTLQLCVWHTHTRTHATYHSLTCQLHYTLEGTVRRKITENPSKMKESHFGCFPIFFLALKENPQVGTVMFSEYQRKRATLSCISCESQSQKPSPLHPVFSGQLLLPLCDPRTHPSLHFVKSHAAHEDELKPKENPVVSQYNVIHGGPKRQFMKEQGRKRKRSRQRRLSSKVRGRRSFHINSI